MKHDTRMRVFGCVYSASPGNLTSTAEGGSNIEEILIRALGLR